MGNLSIEIPDEECVKLFRYEDGDGVAAYLLLFPEHDMKAVKPRIDAQLDHGDGDVSKCVQRSVWGRRRSPTTARWTG